MKFREFLNEAKKRGLSNPQKAAYNFFGKYCKWNDINIETETGVEADWQHPDNGMMVTTSNMGVLTFFDKNGKVTDKVKDKVNSYKSFAGILKKHFGEEKAKELFIDIE